MKNKFKKSILIFSVFILFFIPLKNNMVFATEVNNSSVKDLLTKFFELQISTEPIDCSNIINNTKLAELYNLKFNDLVDSNKDKENMQLIVKINNIENISEYNYIVKFSVTRKFNYKGLESKSEAKDNYTCEIQDIDNNLYINKLINDSDYNEYNESLVKNNKALVGNMFFKKIEITFDNYSNYLEKEITSTKEFQAKEDELIAKLKTQKEDESYKNGIMLKSYDGYNASAAVNYAHKYYEDYNPGFVAYNSDCQNFVSQCVYAGGVPMTDYWHHYTSKYYTYDVTPSWRLVPDFYTYIKNNGYTWGNDYYYDWRVGDVVQMYNPSTEVYSHSVILTGRDPVDGIALYTAHTNNRYDFKLTDGLKEGKFSDWRYIKFWH